MWSAVIWGSHGEIQNLDIDWCDRFNYLVNAKCFLLSHSLKFMFKTGKGEDADIAFYLDMWPEVGSVLKTFIDGKWEKAKY